MFIFLSGYLTKDNIIDYKSFAIKRIKRVLIPYVLWTIFYSIAFKEFNIIENLLLAKTPDIFYYIIVYIEFVIITPLILKLAKSKYRWTGYLITPLVLILLRYIPFIFEINISNQLIRLNCLIWFIFYYLGIVLRNGYLKLKLSNKKCILYLIFSLALSIFEGFIWLKLFSNENWGTTALKLSSTLYSAVVCFIAYEYIKKGDIIKENLFQKIMINIGNCSFGIYLCHFAVKAVLSKLPIPIRIFPLYSITVLILSLYFVMITSKILGQKISKYVIL